MNVYTYYMQVPGLWSDESQKALIELWKKSWTKHGWNPIVLTEADAQKHARYSDFKKVFWEFPTPYGHDYEGSCFMRWVAMAAVGGGFLSDYDVINYGFAPRPVDNKMLVFSDGPGPVWCGAIQAPAQLYESMSLFFYRWPVDKGDWLPEEKIFHCEDQIFLRHMLDAGTHPRPRWLHRAPGCTLYPNLNGPLVHYPSAAMKAGGHWPKHEHIEKLRPIDYERLHLLHAGT